MNYCLIADAVILLIVGVFVWRGKVDGFIKAFIHGVSWVVAFFCAKCFSEPVGAWLSQTMIYDKVCSRVRGALSNIDVTANMNDIVNAVPEEYAGVIEMMDIDLAGIVDSAVAQQENVIEKITEEISSALSLGLSQILSFVLIFVAVVIALRVVAYVLDIFAKLPILHAINGFGGMLLGAFKGIVICWAVVQVGSVVITMFIPELQPMIEQTYLIKLLYNTVPLKILS